MGGAQDVANRANSSAMPGWLGWFPLIAALAVAGFVYERAISWWYFEWTYNQSYYAHAVFIPFFVAAMLWRDKERLKRLPITRSWWGLPFIGLAVLFVLYGYRGDVTATLSLSFMFFTLGASLIAVGGPMWRALLFPICFLLTTIPIIPNQLINIIAFPIQQASAKLAASLLNVIGFEAVRAGTYINMPSYSLNVEVACSGFKTLLGLLSFAGAFAYLVESAQWKRWFLFLIAGPLAILINGIRIMLIAIVGELVSGPAAMQFHDYSGFIVLILGFMFLFSLAKWLKCEKFMGIPLLDPPAVPKVEGEAEKSAEERKREAEEAKRLETEQLNQKMNERFGLPRKGTVALLGAGFVPVLLIGGAMAGVRAFALQPPPKQPVLKVSEVPTKFANTWQQLGVDGTPEKSTLDVLQPEIYLDRSFIGADKRDGMIGLLITGGAGRRTFHDPHECFLGSGMFLRDKPPITIDTEAGPVRVQVAEAENLSTHKKELLLFIFIVDGHVLTSISQVHIENLKKTFLGSNGMPFYFLRFRQMVDGNDNARLEELKTFVRDFWPIVKPIVTTGAK